MIIQKNNIFHVLYTHIYDFIYILDKFYYKLRVCSVCIFFLLKVSISCYKSKKQFFIFNSKR
jgi:hypothetical protein